MITDIYEFLPKYPNIKKERVRSGLGESKDTFDEEIIDPYKDESFQESIFKKKEFYDYKLERNEDFPSKKGDLFNHQVIISRFLSSNTLYDRLLLFHEMGSGKTCTALSVCEKIREENSTIDAAIVIAKNSSMIENFIQELAFKCTDGRYIPKDYDTFNDDVKNRRLRKEYRKFYRFELYDSKNKKWTKNTYEIFAKKLSKMSIKDMKKEYSNKIFILDEIHNIKTQPNKDDKEKLDIYKQFLKLFHNIENSKVMLLSGTPMTDSFLEISDVMNLLLPTDMLMPRLGKFIEEFVDGRNLKNVRKLKEYFTGRVSYLKADRSSIDINYNGMLINPLKHFYTLPMKMSELQTKVYLSTFNEESKGIYLQTEQASLLIYPDNSYGNKGFDKYLEESTMTLSSGKTVKSYKLNTKNKLDKEFISAYSNLDSLNNFSCKYAEAIKIIKQSKKEGKNVFMYEKFVKGSGSIVFSKILELYGYKRTKGYESKPGLRYYLVSDATTYDEEIKRVLNIFNSPKNKNGDYIQVIIGSKKISEGFSLKNIQTEIIMGPHWNYSEISQATARGIRAGSHKDLLKDGPVTLDIYQLVAVSQKSIDTSGLKDMSKDQRRNAIISKSIDLYKYIESERKDLMIKKIERVIKETAIDCALNYERNKSYESDRDFSRNCEYSICDYKCDGVENLEPESLDLSTYNIYYSSKNIEKIIDQIKELFIDSFAYTYDSIKTILTRTYKYNYKDFELLSALKKIIDENLTIKNIYNFDNFLREEKDVYYLTNSMNENQNFLSSYYSMNLISNEILDFEKYFGKFYSSNEIKLITSLFSIKDIFGFLDFFKTLNIKTKVFILQSMIIAEKRNIDTIKVIREQVLRYYKSAILVINGKTYLSFYKDYSVLESNNTWREATEEEIVMIKNVEFDNIYKIETNSLGYYGLFNLRTEKFCIKYFNLRDVYKETGLKYEFEFTPTDDKYKVKRIVDKVDNFMETYNLRDGETEEQVREKLYYLYNLKNPKSGLVCNSFDTWELVKIMIDLGLTETEKAKTTRKNIEALITKIEDNIKIKLDEVTKNSIKRIVSNNKKIKESDRNFTKILLGLDFSKNTMCSKIFKFFYDNNLIIYDDSCGKN